MTQGKVAAAVVVLAVVLVGVGVWLLGETTTTELDRRGIDSEHSQRGETKPRRSRREVEKKAAAETPTELEQSSLEVPPAFDLEQADRNLDLFGRVLDENERGIAGALIRVIDKPWRRGRGLYIAPNEGKVTRKTLRSAEDGSFVIRLGRGEMVNLEVQAPGFGRAEVTGLQAGERRDIVLYPEARLEVLCLNRAEEPVAGVKLRLFGRGELGAAGQRLGETDAKGICEFSGLPPEQFTLSCLSPDFGCTRWEPAKLEAGKTLKIELRADESRALHGLVRDFETGVGIAGALVSASWVMRSNVETDAEGKFVYPAFVGDGSSTLHITAEGYGRQRRKITKADEGELVFELVRGDRVTGRIIGATGAPVEGARVQVVGSAFMNGGQQIDAIGTISDAEGRFTMTSLRRDLSHTLIIVAEGHGRYLLDFPPHPKEPGLIDLGTIELPAPRSISGKVTGPKGVPMARVRLSLRGHNADRTRLLAPDAGLAQDFYGKTETTLTDDLGRYRFGDLSPGSYLLQVAIAGRDDLRRSLELQPDTDLRDIDFSVEDSGTIEVQCVDPAGEPIENVYVYAWPKDGSDRTGGGTTDARGRASLKFLADIDYSVASTRTGKLGEPDPVEARPGGPIVVLRFKSLVPVSGKVVEPDGTPAAQYRLVFSFEEGGSQVLFTDDEGAFELKVGPGTKMLIKADGSRRQGETVRAALPAGEIYAAELRTVAPAEGLTLVLERITQDRILDVLVVDEAGQPIMNASVTAWMPYANTRTDRAGKARFTDLNPGEVFVRAAPPQTERFRLFPAKQRKVNPGDGTVVLTMPPARPISGRVLDAQGRGAADAQVFFTGNGFSNRVRADVDGEFRIAVTGPPPWTLRATHGRDRQARSDPTELHDASKRAILRIR